MKKILLSLFAASAMLASANAQLLFTQYYEGTSNNKWIELKNIGTGSIDLSIYTLSLYANAAAEAWKSGTVSTVNLALAGTLSAGSVYLVAHPSATVPSYATANVTSSTLANFNGNDSVVLWNDSAAFSTAQIVDALSFTNSGNEGVDKSFVRLNADQGYNLTAGSNITTFPLVWNQVSLADVASAGSTTDNYIGYSSVTAVPEPSTYAMVFAGVGMMFWTLRRKRSA